MRTSEFHLAANRRQHFAALEPKVWLETSLLRTWVIADPQVIAKVLRSRHAVILSVEEFIDSIERAYDVTFPCVRFAARHLPLFLEGDIHAERRRSFSRYLASRMAELERHLPDLVAGRLEPFRRKGVVDLVSEVTGPLVRDINSIFVERQVTEEIGALNLLDLFALNKSVRRFKDLEERVGRAIAFLAAEGEDEDLLGSRFSALTMGFETLMTMLTEDLHTAFHDHAGDRVRLPDYPIETGVPLSYRRAGSDFEMGGYAFKAGDLLRLQMQTTGYSGRRADRETMFGAGTHSCVGKQASLRIWNALKQAFDAMEVRGRVKASELVPSHYMVRHSFVHVEVI